MSRIHQINPKPLPTAALDPRVREAYHQTGGNVISMQRPGGELVIARVAAHRVQEVLDRAHAEFGEPGAVLSYPEAL